MKTFLLKAKHFFRRNIYPITITVCTVLVLGIITISAYNSLKTSNEIVTQTNNQNVVESEQESDKTNDDVPTGANPDLNEPEPSKPVVHEIVFGMPIDGAEVLKNYADSSLVYDATTKLWCTHQAVDFKAIEGQEIKSVYDGEILKIESSMMYGTVVHLKISNDLVVVYKGLLNDILVKEGDKVSKGQVIGKITSFLAEKADGVHLHLEVFKNQQLVDPNKYFSINK